MHLGVFATCFCVGNPDTVRSSLDQQLTSPNSKRLRGDIILKLSTAQQPFAARPVVVRGFRLRTY